MIKVLKVSGQSLTPYYQEGDFVLIVKIPFFLDRLKSGDTVAFNHPVYGLMIKLVEHIEPAGELIFVSGTQANSLDSRQLGPIPRKALLGKVIWHIKQPPRRQNLKVE
jgi:signal peptidase I